MALDGEVRKLQNKWRTGSSWPKCLEWIEISGIRGWTGQRVDFDFPVVALVGENGSGKSTVLQAIASAYRASTKKEDRYASDFFPDTPFEKITGATIRFSYREGAGSHVRSVRKPTDRWRGNPQRPERPTAYIDLSRIQPISARVGYAKLIKAGVTEGAHEAFNKDKLDRLANIIGKKYEEAGISLTSVDPKRLVPVLTHNETRYSGFHQGVGEIAVAELLAHDYPKYGIVLVDEVETSLHPRAQRRLIRDLCRVARLNQLQIIVTTHSPYILAELPPEGRIYIMDGIGGKTIVTGVSPDFAMTRMDEEKHPECDLYVEDNRAATLISEIVFSFEKELLPRVKIIPYGSASVGNALGLMAHQNRFPRPSLVYLDGDQSPSTGCIVLPGDDAPERIVFSDLQDSGWPDVSMRIARSPSETIDFLNKAMTFSDHHDWVREAADNLIIGGDVLWQGLCASWAQNCADDQIKSVIASPIKEALELVT